jgi:hypothetical protein
MTHRIVPWCAPALLISATSACQVLQPDHPAEPVGAYAAPPTTGNIIYVDGEEDQQSSTGRNQAITVAPAPPETAKPPPRAITAAPDGATAPTPAGTNRVAGTVAVKLDAEGSFYLAAEAACLASGMGDRFLTWSPGTSSSCTNACNNVNAGGAPGKPSCVQGWTLVTGTTNYRYGSECDTADPSRGQGISGKLCCCTGSGWGQPMFR